MTEATRLSPAAQAAIQPGAAPAAVLQVLPSLRGGGVERSTVEITAALAANGFVPHVASEGGRLVAEIERLGGRHHRLLLASKNPFRILANAGHLAALIRAHGIALIHARSRAPAWSAFLAARRTGIPFVTTCHGIYGTGLPGKHAYNAVMARGDRVIANSEFMARHLAATYGLDAARLRVIPRGVDPAVFDPGAIAPDRTAALARAWGLPEGAPVLLLPGRISALKGQDVLVRALARLRHGTAVAVLIGEPKTRDRFGPRLAALAAGLGLGDRLRWPGHCADMPAALRLADLVLSTSVEPEAFGRTIVEAQAMGRPVIASAHGGALETIAAGETGFLVPPGDPAALAAAIDAGLDLDAAARAALGARARAAVLGRYTVGAMQQATLAVYAELLG